MKTGAAIRTFSQVLRRLYPHEDLEQVLAKQLSDMTEEHLPSVSKKVRNWLQDKNTPKTREHLFQICFALRFTEAQANTLLGMCADTGIHYRNPQELVYAFCLRTERSYAQSVILTKELQNSVSISPQISAFSPCLTKPVFDAFSEVHTLEELYHFFQVHTPEFGTMYETAYVKYCEMLDQLKAPTSIMDTIDKDTQHENIYSIEQIMDTYLQLHVPNGKKTSNFYLLQKVIKKYWPNSKTISNMHQRKEDVSRKALLLLYIVTQEMDNYPEDEWSTLMDDEDIYDADAALEERIYRMNLLLSQYGMNHLDPQNPFDYVVLYAMKASEDDDMSQRMSDVFQEMFPEAI